MSRAGKSTQFFFDTEDSDSGIDKPVERRVPSARLKVTGFFSHTDEQEHVAELQNMTLARQMARVIAQERNAARRAEREARSPHWALFVGPPFESKQPEHVVWSGQKDLSCAPPQIVFWDAHHSGDVQSAFVALGPNEWSAYFGATDRDLGAALYEVKYYDSDFKRRTQECLDKLAALPPNWDSYGAPQIRPSIIRAAHSLIKRLPVDFTKCPCVVPVSSGTLQFEWDVGCRSLELELESSEEIHYLQWDPRHDIKSEGVYPLADIARSVDLIRWVCAGMRHA